MHQWDNEKRDNNIEKLKQIYEQQEIPAELSQVVQGAILKASKERHGVKKNMRWRTLVGFAAALAVFIGAFGVGVTTNEAFAATMADVPILGSLVKVFTAEEVHNSDNGIITDMKIPRIEGLKDKKLQDNINLEVYEKVSRATEETKQQMLEDKKAYLATGGTEEDYIPYEIQVEYEVKCITEDILSFTIWKTGSSASAYFEQYYYNYDLNNNKELTLEDLLGKDYISIANKQISNEIAVRSKNPENTYWDGSDGIEGFKTITKEQPFYINREGNPIIVFNKYEIAPGYMGIQEFEITKNPS